jgi:branched-chain amino acid transport system permease protein
MQWGSDIAQVAASGLLMGLAYALVAVGFTIVFGVMNVVNFAHGHIVMAAMFASFALNRYVGLDPYIAALCLFPVFLVVGGLLYRTAIAPAVGATAATQMLVTLGLLIVIENSANLIFGGELRSVRSPIGESSLHLGTLVLPVSRVLAAAGSLIAIAALWAFLRFTRFGKEIRAAASNELGARLIGIPIQRVFIQAFALATAMAAFAGAMLVPFYLVNPFIGYDFMLKAFVIAIIGGLGSLPGAVLAGLIIGVVEAFGGFYLTASYATALVFGLLMLVLLFRPAGLMGSFRS